MKFFAHNVNGNVGAVTVNDSTGEVKLWYAFDSGKAAGSYGTASAVDLYRMLRPLSGNVSDDKRRALEAAVKEMLEDAGVRHG